MDLFTLFNTPIDDLYDSGFLQEPEPTRNKKMNTLIYECLICKDIYQEKYARQNPDVLPSHFVCIKCQTETMVFKHAIPYTIHYKSRAITRASFQDDVSKECWQCGNRHCLYTMSFTNGQAIKVCDHHFKKYARQTYKEFIRRTETLTEIQERRN